MKAAVEGPFAITCAWCGENATVPKPWMDFCAPCAQAVFDGRVCRVCNASVSVVPDPSGRADRLFIHDGGANPHHNRGHPHGSKEAKGHHFCIGDGSGEDSRCCHCGDESPYRMVLARECPGPQRGLADGKSG